MGARERITEASAGRDRDPACPAPVVETGRGHTCAKRLLRAGDANCRPVHPPPGVPRAERLNPPQGSALLVDQDTLSKRAPSTTRTSLRVFRISSLLASG